MTPGASASVRVALRLFEASNPKMCVDTPESAAEPLVAKGSSSAPVGLVGARCVDILAVTRTARCSTSEEASETFG